MLNLSPKELTAVAKIRGIKGYKSMSEDELLAALTSSKPVRQGEKTETNFSKARIGENTEKYITFSVLIKKEITKIDKDGNDKITKISYKIKFIDSFRYMSSSLSCLVDNLSEELHIDKCTDCKSCLDYMSFN